MAGYIGSKTSVTVISPQTDSRYVNVTGDTMTTDGATVLTVDRATSDGTIIDLQKDGSSVGSVGAATASGVTSIYAGNDDTALWFRNGIDAVTPFSISGNTTRDAAINIGQSGGRFKDLYLSGGVYLGGTGAANYLDDYETGTWTPVIAATGSQPSVTYSFQGGKYTKIGNLVRLDFAITISSISGGSGAAAISGIPFATQSGTTQRSVNAVGYNDIFVASGYSPIFEISDGQTAIFMVYSPNATTQRSSTMQISSAVSGGFKYLQGSIIYYTHL